MVDSVETKPSTRLSRAVRWFNWKAANGLGRILGDSVEKDLADWEKNLAKLEVEYPDGRNVSLTLFRETSLSEDWGVNISMLTHLPPSGAQVADSFYLRHGQPLEHYQNQEPQLLDHSPALLLPYREPLLAVFANQRGLQRLIQANLPQAT